MKVYKWVKRFKRGQTSDDDDDDVCSGQPTTVFTEVKEQVNQYIWDNCRISTDLTASKMSFNYGLAHNNSHDEQVYCKVCARWALKQPTEVHKNMQLEISRNHLQWYHGDDVFVNCSD
jgi:hypothetical protein